MKVRHPDEKYFFLVVSAFSDGKFMGHNFRDSTSRYFLEGDLPAIYRETYIPRIDYGMPRVVGSAPARI